MKITFFSKYISGTESCEAHVNGVHSYNLERINSFNRSWVIRDLEGNRLDEVDTISDVEAYIIKTYDINSLEYK